MFEQTIYRIKTYVLQQRIPRVACINLTALCSGSCEYCGSRTASPDEMTTAQLYSILDDLTEMGCRTIHLTGGDPLMRDDIGEIVQYANSKGLHCAFSSDGSNVLKKRDIVRQFKLIHLSFEGPREIHDTLKFEGAYDRLIEAIEVAQEENVRIVTLTVLTKLNLGCIDYILDTAKEYGFSSFFQPLSRTYIYDDVTPPDLRPTPLEYDEAFNKLIELKKASRDSHVGNAMATLRHFIKPARNFRCHGGRSFVYVHVNGDVYPCWIPPKIKALSCKDVGFKEAFLKMPAHECDSCTLSSTVNLNYFSSLNLKTIANAFSQILPAFKGK